jgi:mono/diheme cytochrome c family protein
MYAFSDRIGPPDRWAIVAYVRALQRSQHASIDDVPQAEQRVLLGEAP